MYLVFILVSGTELLKHCNFLSDENDKGVFYYEVTFALTPKDEGWLPEEPIM